MLQSVQQQLHRPLGLERVFQPEEVFPLTQAIRKLGHRTRQPIQTALLQHQEAYLLELHLYNLRKRRKQQQHGSSSSRRPHLLLPPHPRPQSLQQQTTKRFPKPTSAFLHQPSRKTQTACITLVQIQTMYSTTSRRHWAGAVIYRKMTAQILLTPRNSLSDRAIPRTLSVKRKQAVHRCLDCILIPSFFLSFADLVSYKVIFPVQLRGT